MGLHGKPGASFGRGGGHRLRLGEVPKQLEGGVRKRLWCRSKCERKTAAGGFKKYRSARAASV
jgi:hypothetical protein